VLPLLCPDSSQNWSSFSGRPWRFLRLVSNLVDTFSIERNVALGIFTLWSARLEIRRIICDSGSSSRKAKRVGWGRMSRTTQPSRSSAAVELHDHVACTRLFSQWFGVNWLRLAHQGMKIGLFFGIARAVDEANHIVIDRFGLNHTGTARDSGCRGQA